VLQASGRCALWADLGFRRKAVWGRYPSNSCRRLSDGLAGFRFQIRNCRGGGIHCGTADILFQEASPKACPRRQQGRWATKSAMTKPSPEVLEHERGKLFLTDAELIRRLGVPERIARAAIQHLESKAGFPRKQSLCARCAPAAVKQLPSAYPIWGAKPATHAWW
jgi:hypothetical protein